MTFPPNPCVNSLENLEQKISRCLCEIEPILKEKQLTTLLFTLIKNEDLLGVKTMLEHPKLGLFQSKWHVPELLTHASLSSHHFRKDLLLYLLTKPRPIPLSPFDDWKEELSLQDMEAIATYSEKFSQELAKNMIKHSMFLQMDKIFLSFSSQTQQEIVKKDKVKKTLKKYANFLPLISACQQNTQTKQDLQQVLRAPLSTKRNHQVKM